MIIDIFNVDTVASRVALLPRKKEEIPWLLFIVDAIDRLLPY
jgi:hypothetical protein